MIIEAGYDLYQLLHPAIFRDEESRRGLWLLAMDKDLRELFIARVADQFSGSVESHLAQIPPALECEFGDARYFALAHVVSALGPDIAEWVHDDDAFVREAPALAGYELLGRLVFDGEYMYSSSPRYSFRDYPGCENLPRAAVIPGPHPMFECRCLACTMFEEELAARRARVTSARPESEVRPF